ncbi:MAG: hypothetical protein U5R06_13470 [candidate division KSB1 bacterium]|nr:hypothetical protein [candidate division KSB1 bacterium]
MITDITDDQLKSFFEQYIQDYTELVICVLDSHDYITAGNSAFSAYMDPADALQTLHIKDILISPAYKELRTKVKAGESFQNIMTIQNPAQTAQKTLKFTVFPKDPGAVLIGEFLYSSDQKVVQELSTLNSQLANTTRKLHRKNKELEKAYEKINTLNGLLPICASCKKIRDDKGYWNHVEEYISEHSRVDFSHSICPDCSRKLYPEFYTEMEQEKQKR